MLSATAAISKLERIYGDLPDGAEVSSADRASVDAAGGPGAATYGELTLEGSARVLQWLRLGPLDHFFDLGSGTGKIPILAALMSDVGHATGVELSRRRHDVAEQALARVGDVDGRVALVHEDLLTTDLSAATVIFTGSRAFPESLVAKLARRAIDLPRLRLMLSLKPVPASVRFQQRAEFDVPTTWAAKDRLHVYERR